MENRARSVRSGNNLMTRGANGSLKHPHKFSALFPKIQQKGKAQPMHPGLKLYQKLDLPY